MLRDLATLGATTANDMYSANAKASAEKAWAAEVKVKAAEAAMAKMEAAAASKVAALRALTKPN